jgi:hypothetical protein
MGRSCSQGRRRRRRLAGIFEARCGQNLAIDLVLTPIWSPLRTPGSIRTPQITARIRKGGRLFRRILAKTAQVHVYACDSRFPPITHLTPRPHLVSIRG